MEYLDRELVFKSDGSFGAFMSSGYLNVLFVMPIAHQFVEQFVFAGNKAGAPMFYYVDVSGANLQLDSFEELAMPLFDQLYNFAHWLTQNREEAEDLVQETYAKALKGFSSFQLGCVHK
jgi:hypothetical protein